MSDTSANLVSYTLLSGANRESTKKSESATKQEVKAHGARRRHSGGTEPAETGSPSKLETKVCGARHETPAEMDARLRARLGRRGAWKPGDSAECPRCGCRWWDAPTSAAQVCPECVAGAECDSCGEVGDACSCGCCVRCGAPFTDADGPGCINPTTARFLRHAENPAVCRGCYDEHAAAAAAMMANALGMDGRGEDVAAWGLEWALDRSGHPDVWEMLLDTDPDGAERAALGVVLGWFLRTFSGLGAPIERRLRDAGYALEMLACTPGASYAGRDFLATAGLYYELACQLPTSLMRVEAYRWHAACLGIQRAFEKARDAGVTL